MTPSAKKAETGSASSSNADSAPAQPIGPRIVQGSRAPVFKGGGAGNLLCNGCRHVLVEGYNSRSLIAIGIQCFLCKTVTQTAPWPIGEPLPRRLVTLGDNGAFLIAGTVDMTNGNAAFSCDQEIARVAVATGVRNPQQDGLDITLEGLQALGTKLEVLSSGAFGKGLASTQRALRAGNARFLNYPPAWAMTHLQRQIALGALDLRGADGVAVVYLQTLLHLIARWQHHPLFSIMSKALVHEFHHVLTMLITASYLADHGNPIGFTDPGNATGRSPDLFINIGPMSRVGIEVKAPTDLQWPQPLPTLERLERIVERHLRDARGQIAAGAGGIVVLGSSIPDPGLRGMFEASVASLIDRGGVSTRIAAVAGVCLAPHPQLEAFSGTNLNSTVSAEFFIQRNTRYAGPDFLRT